MADKTKIEWTDATWNVVNGCTRISEGCGSDRGGGCYAERLAATRLRNHPSRSGLATMTSKGPRWTGEVRFNEAVLTQPLRWKRPRRIFVCAHGDLFHESVPDEWIDRVFAVMALCPQHQFQVLTKRSARMREYLTSGRSLFVWRETRNLGLPEQKRRDRLDSAVRRRVFLPLPNVWLGVSVEDQQRADERVPDLLATPAAVRWLSCEPLLGPVDLTRLRPPSVTWLNALEGIEHIGLATVYTETKLDWIVVGGESGPNARPMHPDWARSLRDQCEAAGVPFLFKQWGEWLPCEVDNPGDGTGTVCYPDDGSERDDVIPEGARRAITSLVRQDFWRVGKKRAGRLLDGVEHNGFPEIVAR